MPFQMSIFRLTPAAENCCPSLPSLSPAPSHLWPRLNHCPAGLSKYWYFDIPFRLASALSESGTSESASSPTVANFGTPTLARSISLMSFSFFQPSMSAGFMPSRATALPMPLRNWRLLRAQSPPFQLAGQPYSKKSAVRPRASRNCRCAASSTGGDPNSGTSACCTESAMAVGLSVNRLWGSGAVLPPAPFMPTCLTARAVRVVTAQFCFLEKYFGRFWAFPSLPRMVTPAR